jgi:hypothetical protein
MAAQPDLQEFKFPDEVEPPKDEVNTVTLTDPKELEVEVVDDTPPQDRDRAPMPKEVVQELEDDDLEEYSEKVKKRLSQMKKVWHDERREKERALREREEALNYAAALDRKAKELQKRIGHGEQLFATEMTKAATNDIAAAKERLKKAYEAGEPDQIADAQEALTDAKLRLREYEKSKTTGQPEETSVQAATEQVPAPRQVVDPKAEAWRQRNTWFGVDRAMTGFALGLHEDLVNSGVDPRSDAYYKQVDETMRKTFPARFETEETVVTKVEEKPSPRTKPPVVASVSRSTAPTRIRLTQTQVALAKKLGLTPEAYANELIKLGNYNG